MHRRWPSAGGTSRGCPTPPGENKRRDLERDPAARGRSRMSRTQPPRLEGGRSRAGLPRPRPLGRGKDGRKSVPHVETSPPQPARTRSFLALRPSFPPWKPAAFGRGVAFGGAGRRGRAQGGQRANGCPRKPVSGPPQVARWAGASTQAGQGQGQRPRAGQGPSRGPAAAPLAGASQAPGDRGRGVDKSPVPPPHPPHLQPGSLGVPLDHLVLGLEFSGFIHITGLSPWLPGKWWRGKGSGTTNPLLPSGQNSAQGYLEGWVGKGQLWGTPVASLA